MGIKTTRRIRDSYPQSEGWTIERKSSVGWKNYEKVQVNNITWQHHVFNKNKKKKLKEDLDFIAIKKKSPKDDVDHEKMFGPYNHPLFKKLKVYDWYPYHPL